MFSNRDFRLYVDPNGPARFDDYGAVMFLYYGDCFAACHKVGACLRRSTFGLAT
jgi:hypothetical protein